MEPPVATSSYPMFCQIPLRECIVPKHADLDGFRIVCATSQDVSNSCPEWYFVDTGCAQSPRRKQAWILSMQMFGFLNQAAPFIDDCLNTCERLTLFTMVGCPRYPVLQGKADGCVPRRDDLRVIRSAQFLHRTRRRRPNRIRCRMKFFSRIFSPVIFSFAYRQDMRSVY